MSEENQKSEETAQPTENYRKLTPPPGAHALDNPNVTPENYQQAEPGRDYIPLIPGKTPEQQQRAQGGQGPQRQQQQQQQIVNRTLQDKEQEEADRNRDIALAKAANDKVGSTDQALIRDLDIARARHIRELATHDPVWIPMHQVKEDAEEWFNPITEKYEKVYKREGEDKDAWIPQPFKRFKIDKYSWDEAERFRIEMVLVPESEPIRKRKMDAKWLEYLAYKFFNMKAEDMSRAQWDVLRDYIVSALFRTNTGLPYYQQTSDSSLQGNNPIR